MTVELDIMREIIRMLDKTGIPYMITGSIAGNFYGTPRMTRDIDVVIELKEDKVEAMFGAFEKDFYVDKDMVLDAVKRRGMFNAIHYQSVFKVDFIVKKDDPYRREEFKRRKKIEVQGTEFYITAPEDLILSKLYWAKESLSEMQINDVKNLMKQVEGLDGGYLLKWAQYLGLEELYHKVKQ